MFASDSVDSPDFHAVSAALQHCGLTQGPAEAQGLALGLLVAGVSEPLQLWREEMYAEMDPGNDRADECRSVLDRVFFDVFSDTERLQPLALLLPQDIQVNAERLAAVREWCQGFLYGFGLGGDAASARVSQAGRELLGDIVEFTRLDTAPIENSSDNQAALIAIEEYLREGVMLMRDEMHQDRGEA